MLRTLLRAPLPRCSSRHSCLGHDAPRISGTSIRARQGFSRAGSGSRRCCKSGSTGRRKVSNFKMVAPRQSALYSKSRKNSDQLASEMALASLWFRSMFLIFRCSTAMTWFSFFNSWVVSFCKVSRRMFRMCSWMRAMRMCCFLWFFERSIVRERRHWALASFFWYFGRYFGFSTFVPSLMVQNALSPTSMPIFRLLFSLIVP